MSDIHARIADAKRNESYRTISETRYWGQQWRLIALAAATPPAEGQAEPNASPPTREELATVPDAMARAGAHVLSEWLDDAAPMNERRYIEPARSAYAVMRRFAAPQAAEPAIAAVPEGDSVALQLAGLFDERSGAYFVPGWDGRRIAQLLRNLFNDRAELMREAADTPLALVRAAGQPARPGLAHLRSRPRGDEDAERGIPCGCAGRADVDSRARGCSRTPARRGAEGADMTGAEFRDWLAAYDACPDSEDEEIQTAEMVEQAMALANEYAGDAYYFRNPDRCPSPKPLRAYLTDRFAELEAARVDAERYRWLRDECQDIERMAWSHSIDRLDEAIDAARATTTPKGPQ